jgi:hypothetical protein
VVLVLVAAEALLVRCREGTFFGLVEGTFLGLVDFAQRARLGEGYLGGWEVCTYGYSLHDAHV